MKISLITMTGGPTDVEGHRAGCADVAKKLRTKGAKNGNTVWTFEVNSEREAFLAYNEDFINEADGDESNSWVITWFPCCSELPPVHEDWFPTPEAPVEEVATPITKTEAFRHLSELLVTIRSANHGVATGDLAELVDALENTSTLATLLRTVALNDGINKVTWTNK